MRCPHCNIRRMPYEKDLDSLSLDLHDMEKLLLMQRKAVNTFASERIQNITMSACEATYCIHAFSLWNRTITWAVQKTVQHRTFPDTLVAQHHQREPVIAVGYRRARRVSRG